MNNSNKAFMGVMAIMVVIIGIVMYIAGKGSAGSSSASQQAATSTVESSKAVSDMRELLDRPAPDFSLKDRQGALHKLSDLRGKTVVLFFNEGLMCYPACWNQMAKLSADQRLNSGGIVSYSVVVDQPASWSYAVQKMPELADAKVFYDELGDVSRAYAMLTAKSSMHYGAYPGHTYVVIDAQGIVRYVFDDPRMAINNDLIVSEINSLAASASAGAAK